MASELLKEIDENPEEDPTSYGLVQTQYLTLFEPPHELKLASKTQDSLGPITVAYETYGTLSPEKDNAIFICHALTGDAHAAGRHDLSDRKPGWWDNFVGPGKGLDTNEYFIICANVLGGCQGTTGPGSINPLTGKNYSLSFPFITIEDIVEVHSALVKHLGINHLLSVIGGSLGGMQVLEWASRYPTQMESAIVLASAANLTAQGIAFNAVGRHAILVDPSFRKGNYPAEELPKIGLGLARMIAHITYLSESSIEKKFGRRLQHSDSLAFDLLKTTEFQIESYLHYQGERFVERFDANSYLYLTRAMDYFDLGQKHGSLEKAFQNGHTKFLVTSYDTDWLFPSSQSREIVTALLKAKQQVSFIEFESPYGHDSFLIEAKQLARVVRPFLQQAYESVSRTR